jgi:hypothetical protein
MTFQVRGAPSIATLEQIVAPSATVDGAVNNQHIISRLTNFQQGTEIP